MIDQKRLRLRARVVIRPVELGVHVAHPELTDCELLGSLMLDAYRGTVDERYETATDATAHIGRYFEGEFGKPLLTCSYMALHNVRPIGVTLVSMDGDEPLLAQAYTAPDWQNRGVATALIQMSMNALAVDGLRVLNLVVSVGNQSAEHVYRKLGFEPVDEGL